MADANWKVRQSVAKIVLPIAFEVEVHHHDDEAKPFTRPQLADIAGDVAEAVFEVLERDRTMEGFRDYYLDSSISWKMTTFPEEDNQ